VRRCLALAALLLAGAAFAQPALRAITILHTNDLHAHLLPSDAGAGGFAQLAAAIRHERENCSGCLLLNAGDLVQGTPVSTIFRGVPAYEIANLFGFDAATLGNHEFDYGWQTTERFIKIARYPMVCANVVDADGRLMAKPYVILRANGVRVGVIGAMMQNLASMETAARLGSWHVLPLVETVRKYIAEVRRQSDVIVLLGHLNANEERDVLRLIPEVAIEITGHDHRGMTAAMQQDGRVAVRMMAYGEELGRLDLRVDTDKKALVSCDWKRIPISAKGPVAEDVDREVKRWEGEVTKAVDVPVANSRKEMKKEDLKPLIERIMREEMHTDFAFINNGGIRDKLPAGRILVRHIWNIMPFDNVVVVARVKGSQVPPVVARDHAIDPERLYTLAVTDFTAANQSAGSELGTTGLEFSTEGPMLRDLLIEWFKKQREVGE
jgi:5'-nucleotidase/UDP-sugar diphosphatase